MIDLATSMKWAFGLEVLAVYVVIRSFFAGFLCMGEPKGRKWQETPFATIGLSLIAIGWGYAVYVYYAIPESMPWAQIGLPGIVRWFGFGASIVVCGYMIWIFKTIGTAGAKHLVTFDDMKLVTWGPYSRIRHPMYTGMFLQGVTWLMMTDNWGVGGGFLLLTVFVVVSRIKREEEVLLEHFGDDYRQYMLDTGRFFPPGARRGRPRS